MNRDGDAWHKSAEVKNRHAPEVDLEQGWLFQEGGQRGSQCREQWGPSDEKRCEGRGGERMGTVGMRCMFSLPTRARVPGLQSGRSPLLMSRSRPGRCILGVEGGDRRLRTAGG
jgi:hypothetical protein